MGARTWFAVVATTTLIVIFVAPPALAQTEPREVVVHLDAPSGVTLEREDGNDDWTEVCFAPCDLPFSAQKHYRVGGGIRDSKPFTLHETQQGLEVMVVDPRSRGAHAFGDVLIGIGSAWTFAGGFVALIAGSIEEHCSSSETRDSCGGGNLIGPSIAVALAGVTAILLGVDLVVANNVSYVHPQKRKLESHDDMNRARTALFDLSRSREDSWMTLPLTLSGAVPIFSYRF